MNGLGKDGSGRIIWVLNMMHDMVRFAVAVWLALVGMVWDMVIWVKNIMHDWTCCCVKHDLVNGGFGHGQ